jgi:hypothetical protein
MLRLVESRFGARDRSYTILGIEFGVDVPHLWYPGNCKNIVIQLAANAMNDHYLARFQLAHECVHLLSPTGGQCATVLEEGLAVVFSEDYVSPNAAGISPVDDDPKYAASGSLVRQLLSAKPDLIERLRAIEPAFTSMTAHHLKVVMPDVDDETARRLLSPFDQVEADEILA